MNSLDLFEIVDVWPEIDTCTRGVREVAARAYREAVARNDLQIRPEHLLFGLIRLATDQHQCIGARTLVALNLDLRLFHMGLQNLTQLFGDMCTRGPTPNIESAELLILAAKHSRDIQEYSFSKSGCGSAGLLLAFLDSPNTVPYQAFTLGWGLQFGDVLLAIEALRKLEP